MTFAKIENGLVVEYPYSFDMLRRDNPETSFPGNPSIELLEEWGVFLTHSNGKPPYNPITQNCVLQKIENTGSHWEEFWVVEDATQEEVAQRTSDLTQNAKASRENAYRTESDPLFFKAQRGEATMDEWLALVAEIKVRYPYP